MGYISSRSILIKCQLFDRKTSLSISNGHRPIYNNDQATPKKRIFLFPLPEVKSLGFRLYWSLE